MPILGYRRDEGGTPAPRQGGGVGGGVGGGDGGDGRAPPPSSPPPAASNPPRGQAPRPPSERYVAAPLIRADASASSPASPRRGGDDDDSDGDSSSSSQILLDDSHGSRDSSSSVGIRSTFVQSQILKMKSSGNWSREIAPDADAEEVEEVEVGAVVEASARRVGGPASSLASEAAVAGAAGAAAGASADDDDDDDDDDYLSITVEPTSDELRLSTSHHDELDSDLEELLEYGDDDSGDDDSGDDDGNNGSGTDAARLDDEETVEEGRVASGAGGASSEGKRRAASSSSITDFPRDAAIDGGVRLAFASVPVAVVSVAPPSQQHAQLHSSTPAPPHSSTLHGSSSSSLLKRTLSTNSLVAMLKIQPICEREEWHDDMQGLNLAETVEIADANASRSSAGELLDLSDVSDRSNAWMGTDDEYAGGGMLLEDDDESEEDDGDDEADGNADGADEKKERRGSLGKSESRGFLPSFSPEPEARPSGPIAIDLANLASIPNPPSGTNDSNPKNHLRPREGSGDSRDRKSALLGTTSHSDTDTFFLRSIASGADLTHASDAPSYDYDSISTLAAEESNKAEKEEEGRQFREGSRGEAKGAAEAARDEEAAGGTALAEERRRRRASGRDDDDRALPLREGKPPTTAPSTPFYTPVEAVAAGTTTLGGTATSEPPSKPADPRAAVLSREVCEVLGLPRDEGIRPVHRGIMSHNTELKLREMAKSEAKAAASGRRRGGLVEEGVEGQGQRPSGKLGGGGDEEEDDGGKKSADAVRVKGNRQRGGDVERAAPKSLRGPSDDGGDGTPPSRPSRIDRPLAASDRAASDLAAPDENGAAEGRADTSAAVKGDSSSSSSSSDDCSDDVFGTSRTSSKKTDDEWERIRRERAEHRKSLQSSKISGGRGEEESRGESHSPPQRRGGKSYLEWRRSSGASSSADRRSTIGSEDSWNREVPRRRSAAGAARPGVGAIVADPRGTADGPRRPGSGRGDDDMSPRRDGRRHRSSEGSDAAVSRDSSGDRPVPAAGSGTLDRSGRSRGRRARRIRRSDDDDDASVASTASSYLRTQFGKMYRRLSSRNFSASSLSHDDDDDLVASSSSSEEDDDDDDDDGPYVPLWEKNVLAEGEYYLAMSMLVYIYSLLRETSMLGHTDVSFDEIDVNSYQSDVVVSCGGGGGSSGVDVRASRRAGGGGGRGGGGGGAYGGAGGPTKFLSKTRSAGFVIRVVMDELEKKGAFSSVEKNEQDMSVLNEFKMWVHDSRCRQLDAATESTIKELRRKVARRRWKRAIHAVRLMVRLGQSDSNNFQMSLARHRRQQQGGAFNPRTSMELLGDAISDSMDKLKETLRKPPPMPRALAGSVTWMHDQRKQILQGLGMNALQESLPKRHSLVGENEIKEIINDALEEPRFFLEGSLLSNLIESGIEVVWFGDRHPNDVVYSICCNRQSKRVSVVFRGSVNSHNWFMNMKFAMSEHPNPIAEDYPGREDMLGLHTGFSLYMMRQRKDDSLTKVEEIFSNIDNIGKELAPDGDYELSITGHSLGGALATILSFYAATSNVFSKVKTIRLFTFAAPRVGCQRFLYAVQHLERIGKLRMARFCNTCDIVPLIPFHGISRSYKHVGMSIRLLGVDKYAQYWLRKALDVTYPKYHGVMSQLWRGLLSSFVRNANTVKGYKRNHTLSEYQRRIRFALEYRSVLAQSGFFKAKKKHRLKTLNEYYFIKGASNVTCTGELTRITLEDRARENVRRESRKMILIIAVIALVEAIVLLGVLKKLVPCESYPTLLYPLYLLSGCRNEERAQHVNALGDEDTNATFERSPMNRATGLPMQSNVNDASSPKNKTDFDEDTSQFAASQGKTPTVSEEPALASSLPSLPVEISASEDSNDIFPSEDRTSSWNTFWMHILRKSGNSPEMLPLCVWGHCKSRSWPVLPWGIRTKHLTLPPTLDFRSHDSPHSPPDRFGDAEGRFSETLFPSL